MQNNLPPHWSWMKLGEVCEVVMGQSPPSSTYNTSRIGLPFFQGKAEFTELHPVAEKWCSEPNKIADTNDILLSVRAPVGATNIANQASCIGRGLAALRFKNYKYLFYFLRSIEKQLDKKGTGTTFKAISGETIRLTDFPLAPEKEQENIVTKIEALFSELDKGIENLKTAQQRLKVYRQAVLKWAFEGKLTEEWRRKRNGKSKLFRAQAGQQQSMAAEPEVEYAERVGLEPFLSANWEMKSLGEIAEVKRGKSRHRPRDAKELYGGNYPFIQTGEVKAANGGVIRTYSQTYSEAGLKQSKLWKKGTLCLTIAANIADTAFLGFDSCFPDSIVGITVDDQLVSIQFINYYVQKLKKEIESGASATAQKNINVEYLEKLPIPFPSLEEQHQIVSEIESRLSVCDKLETTIEENLQQAEALRQSILKKAFEGRLI
ncbi:MAG: restriction endonuclease subunit S [Chitinophagales bacterium]|nr:restriction endonuclease subunit S [Chitinophagales bacterium]